jgi:murein L,D-transpeptidase YafK
MIPKILLITAMIFLSGDFKSEQLKHSKVKQAYAEKLKYIEGLLKSKQMKLETIQLYLRAFKQEGQLDVWAKNLTDKKFQLLVTYDICSSSGTLGPKRKEGDYQVPEGFYHINHFNPESNYYLSLGVSYPNASDKVFADKMHPGGAIYIHGNCVTIGCIPITDDKIKELYILALEACHNGQKQIPVTVFPVRMIQKNLDRLKKEGRFSTETLNLWLDLKAGYDLFDKTFEIPAVEFIHTGRHRIG